MIMKQDHDFDEFFVDVGKIIYGISQYAEIVYNIKEDSFGFICYSNFDYIINYKEGNEEYYQYCNDCIELGDSLLDCINKIKANCLHFRRENPLRIKDDIKKIKDKTKQLISIQESEHEKTTSQYYKRIEILNEEIKWANDMLAKCVSKKKNKEK